jgi:hypothetical protein
VIVLVQVGDAVDRVNPILLLHHLAKLHIDDLLRFQSSWISTTASEDIPDHPGQAVHGARVVVVALPDAGEEVVGLGGEVPDVVGVVPVDF